MSAKRLRKAMQAMTSMAHAGTALHAFQGRSSRVQETDIAADVNLLDSFLYTRQFQGCSVC